MQRQWSRSFIYPITQKLTSQVVRKIRILFCHWLSTLVLTEARDRKGMEESAVSYQQNSKIQDPETQYLAMLSLTLLVQVLDFPSQILSL